MISAGALRTVDRPETFSEAAFDAMMELAWWG
jgi:hypothetical protein